VWVWSTKAADTGVKVTANVGYAEYVGRPHFSVCPVGSGATCKLGRVPTGQAYELQVGVKVGAKATLGEQVQLTAKATGKKALSFTGSATDLVTVMASAMPSPSPSSNTVTPPATLPPTSLPPTSLPPITGGTSASTNPASLFPTVGPPTSSPPSSIGLPTVKPRKNLHVADVAATVPLDPRLIGGQLAGLAVLAGAVVMAIARLSLRTSKPTDGKTGQTGQGPAE
jgi:hypothetical protein